MARKLGEVVALAKAAQQRANKDTGALDKAAQRAAEFAGLARTYQPLTDDGKGLPAEGTGVRRIAEEMLAQFAAAYTPALDLAAAKDEANTQARADVVVNGEPVLTGVSVPHLLYLEHQLANVLTFVGNLPVLDPGENWTKTPDVPYHVSDPSPSLRVERHEEPVVLYAATKEHPAQVKMVTREVPVGTWTTRKFSGALTENRKRELLDRIHSLQDAVKTARERANQAEAPSVSVGAEIFGYLFA